MQPITSFGFDSSSLLALTRNGNSQRTHVTSLCSPSKVGAIDPVGMTNASASNVRNKNASTKAMAIDSMVSRKPSFMACGGGPELSLGDLGFGAGGLCLLAMTLQTFTRQELPKRNRARRKRTRGPRVFATGYRI